MSTERARGALLYSLFALVLLVGAGWYVRSAPAYGPSPQMVAWRATVEEKLPDSPALTDARTVVLPAGVDRQESASVEDGSYLISVVCAGESRVRITLSDQGNDTGRGLACGDDPTPYAFSSGLTGYFTLSISVDAAGPVALRWTLRRLRAF